jgi:glycosyltransferase involved in cell wall biosynthesis
LKIVVVSGSLPPDPCGVGAYAARLVEALRPAGVEVVVLAGQAWRARDALGLRAQIDALDPDIVHLQYPTVGYGHGLAPQVLSILRPGVVTLHEVRHTHVLRRLSLTAFGVSARRIVFTTQPERQYFLRFAPWLRERTSVIPVGSSIPAVESSTPRRLDEVVHFGLIRPDKGLEEVIELGRIMQKHRSGLRVRVVGDVGGTLHPYFDSLRRSSAELPVVWELGLSLPRVAEKLVRASIGYLPFPDGASERRTSLLALLEAGVATITTRGVDTPPALADAVAFADDPAEAFEIVEELRADALGTSRLATRGREYAAGSDWGRIADMHLALYDDVLHDEGQCRRSA